jgi:signal transduction histidine kinase
MRTRLTDDDGQTVVISAPGKGTRIRFVFPVTA